MTILRPFRPTPETSLYSIFDYQQTTEFLNRDAVVCRPICRGSWLQRTSISARKRVSHPGGYFQSMGASVRLKTGVLHNIVRDEQVKADPGVLTCSAGLAAHSDAV